MKIIQVNNVKTIQYDKNDRNATLTIYCIGENDMEGTMEDREDESLKLIGSISKLTKIAENST